MYVIEGDTSTLRVGPDGGREGQFDRNRRRARGFCAPIYWTALVIISRSRRAQYGHGSSKTSSYMTDGRKRLFFYGFFFFFSPYIFMFYSFGVLRDTSCLFMYVRENVPPVPRPINSNSRQKRHYANSAGTQ